MPNRHVLRKKSRSRRSSPPSPSNKAKLRHKRTPHKHRKPAADKQSTRTSQLVERGERLVADMRGDPSLTFTSASRKWRLDPRWLRKQFGAEFQKDTSGRVRVKVRNPRHKTLYKPTATPGMPVPVVTRSKRERRLLGQWMAAVNAAGRNDWSKMRRFPKGQRIGGVLLETDPNEVQEILKALAEEESPYEGLYRAIARPR
jgi:hypothetical protein